MRARNRDQDFASVGRKRSRGRMSANETFYEEVIALVNSINEAESNAGARDLPINSERSAALEPAASPALEPEVIPPAMATLIEQIDECHQAFLESSRTTLEHAVRLGQLLERAKKQVGHGGWARWVELNCPFSARTGGRPNSRVTSRHLDQSRGIRALMSSSNRPYGFTCSQINGVSALRSRARASVSSPVAPAPAGA